MAGSTGSPFGLPVVRRLDGQPRPLGGPDDERHGTLSAYTSYACRCGPCRAANAAYHRAYRAARKARRAEALEAEAS